jgi:hypothetical protein
VVEIMAGEAFLEKNPRNMVYVGFLRSAEGGWFPLCLMSRPEEGGRLDTLYVSPSLKVMSDVTAAYKEKASGIKDTLVQFLMISEVSNLMERYGLVNVAVVSADEECGCGSGCDG